LDNPAELEIRDATHARLAGLFDPDLDFRKLALEATYYARGFRLIDKDLLIGVPHVIIAVTYREGYTDKNTKITGDYVSVEAVVADADTLTLPQVSHQLPDPLLVAPNEPVVYNDGGTGIRRTLTELFHEMGIINIGNVVARKGENSFDHPMSQWVSGADRAAEGITATGTGEKFRYVALRGLRRSDYENEYGEGTTHYFG
jgi:hypothetical protein